MKSEYKMKDALSDIGWFIRRSKRATVVNEVSNILNGFMKSGQVLKVLMDGDSEIYFGKITALNPKYRVFVLDSFSSTILPVAVKHGQEFTIEAELNGRVSTFEVNYSTALLSDLESGFILQYPDKIRTNQPRKSVRVSLQDVEQLEIILSDSNKNIYSGLVRNISQGGVGLSTVGSVADLSQKMQEISDQDLDCKIKLSEKELECKMQIRNISYKDGDQSTFVGGQIIAEGSRNKQLLDQYINGLERKDRYSLVW